VKYIKKMKKEAALVTNETFTVSMIITRKEKSHTLKSHVTF